MATTNQSQWIGRIDSKSISGKRVIVSHWKASDNYNPNLFTKCTGCALANQLVNNSKDCLIQIRSNQLCSIGLNSYHYHNSHQKLLIDHQQLIQQSVGGNMDSSIREHVFRAIEASPLEITLINAIIDSDNAKVELIQLWTNLKYSCDSQQLTHLNGFTDGSINFKTPSRNNQVIMGAGWVIPDVDMSYGLATVLWPSSTKAELSAILLLL